MPPRSRVRRAHLPRDLRPAQSRRRHGRALRRQLRHGAAGAELPIPSATSSSPSVTASSSPICTCTRPDAGLRHRGGADGAAALLRRLALARPRRRAGAHGPRLRSRPRPRRTLYLTVWENNPRHGLLRQTRVRRRRRQAFHPRRRPAERPGDERPLDGVTHRRRACVKMRRAWLCRQRQPSTADAAIPTAPVGRHRAGRLPRLLPHRLADPGPGQEPARPALQLRRRHARRTRSATWRR